MNTTLLTGLDFWLWKFCTCASSWSFCLIISHVFRFSFLLCAQIIQISSHSLQQYPLIGPIGLISTIKAFILIVSVFSHLICHYISSKPYFCDLFTAHCITRSWKFASYQLPIPFSILPSALVSHHFRNNHNSIIRFREIYKTATNASGTAWATAGHPAEPVRSWGKQQYSWVGFIPPSLSGHVWYISSQVIVSGLIRKIKCEYFDYKYFTAVQLLKFEWQVS